MATGTLINGFPQSSNEYDQWVKQGRTFSGGKWYEAGTQPIVKASTSTPKAGSLTTGSDPNLVTDKGTGKGYYPGGISNNKPTLDDLMKTAQGIQTKMTEAQTAMTQLKEADTTKDIVDSQGKNFEPPTGTSTSSLADFSASITATLDRQRAALEAAYQKDIERIQANQEKVEAERQRILDEQKDILEQDVKPLTEPFRADLEKTERERLQVEDNYFANQQLTEELDGLLTEIQATVEREKNVTGLASIREPRVAQSVEEATARVGVIEASMAARNNQINVANNLIDRSVAAMTADRQDQLNYYSSLLSFYDGQKDFEENKIIQLTADEKEAINKKVNLLETDLNITLSNVENIKAAMMDPDTAQAYAQAGITLNDSPELIAEKLAKYGYTQEVSSTSNQMQTNGYTYLSPGQNAPAGSEVITTTDSQGKTKTWYKEDTSAPQLYGSADKGYYKWDPATNSLVPVSGMESTEVDERVIRAELSLRRQELLQGQADVDEDTIYQQMLNELLVSPDFSTKEREVAERILNELFAVDSGKGDNIFELRVNDMDKTIAAEERILKQIQDNLNKTKNKMTAEQYEMTLSEIRKQKEKIEALKEDRENKVQTGQSSGLLSDKQFNDIRADESNPFSLFNMAEGIYNLD